MALSGIIALWIFCIGGIIFGVKIAFRSADRCGIAMEIIGVIIFTMSSIGLFVAGGVSEMYFKSHNSYTVRKKQIELETRYIYLMGALQDDDVLDKGVIIEQAIDYNIEVLQGREDLRRRVLGELTYPLYDDTPLIECREGWVNYIYVDY